MQKTKFSVYFIFVSIFTFIAIFTAVVQNSYSNLITPVNQVNTTNNLSPLNPSLDSSVVSQIEKREEFSSDIQLINLSSSVSAQPVVTSTLPPQ